MTSETITRNDLKAIFDSVLPSTAVDYIVEQGTDGIWTYRKWNSGIAECWGSNDTTQSFSAWGSIYSTDVAHVAFPSGLFIEAPICLAQSRISSGNSISSINSGLPTKDWTPGVTIIRGTTAGEGTATTFYQAKGRWK